MRILAEGTDFTQEEILKNAYEKDVWEKLFLSHFPEITFDLTITAPEIERILVYINNGSGECIDHVFDTGISEFLMGCTYTQGE